MIQKTNSVQQSFYSVYSHYSVFEPASQRAIESNQQIIDKNISNTNRNNDSNPNSNNVQQHQYQYQQTRMIKIAQSNINLDDCALDIDVHNSVETDRKSYQTVQQTQHQQQYTYTLQENSNNNNDRGFRKQSINKQNIISIPIQQQQHQHQHHQILQHKHNQIQPNPHQTLQQQNISAIHPNTSQQNQLDQSICLLKQIDCLSVEQVSPQQLKQIKNKIQILNKQQMVMQGSLMLANQMLKSAKNRNSILEQQIANYRRNQQEYSKMQSSVHTYRIKQIKNNGTLAQEKRIFPQHSTQTTSTNLAKFKNIYRECSIHQSFCIYQNQGYKIEVFYERQKHISEPKALTFTVKLTPHHHIIGKKQFKFGLEPENSKQMTKDDLHYDGVAVVQKFGMWPEGKFNITMQIHQYDQGSGRHHSHPILVPLPITHFFEPRMMLLREQIAKSIKSKTTQYTLQFTGNIAVNWMQKLKQIWWMKTWMSCLGWNQLFMFQLSSQQDSKALTIQVYGKKDGKVTLGLIQYLSFFIAN